ncbi:Ig-like domain-containing protein [Arthrobacter sp. NQ7]|uniref:OmpL47-type beta-barrel domain-containing protein n=1 Tax=Arthrobacter sp. NQ7 TaxID=3032303 RepID=UPI00240EB9BC|nr:Ig-like domain-containing protein [Arthrobacter sp. NQ7]MDJ0455857.1 Ig-like domain-containing protein [Arthrobacter sp. NQ7]
MSIAIRKMPFGFRLPSGRLAWIVTAVLLLLGTATAAYGFWASTTSSNNATAAADTLAPGSKPAVTANGASLSVSWAAGTTVNGRAATGYTVTRYAAATGGTGTPATGGCAGTVTTLTCTEQNVPGGIWYYTVTPTIALWTGAESPRSSGVSSDSTAPIASVSGLTPAPNAAGWNNTSPVTVAITANDGAGGSGVASISYMVDGGAQQTVSGASASATVTGDGTHTVSYFATDNAGNAGTAQSQTVRIDTTAPAAPGLSVPAYVNLANVAAVPVTGTAEAGAKISLTASDTGTGTPHSTSATATASATGAWSVTLDMGTFKQGTVNYSATAGDAAGNTSAAKAATSIKDTVAPAAPQALSVPTYVNSANSSAVPVSGTAEAGGTVTVTATDAGAVHTVSGTATASGTGAWSLNLNLGTLNDGTASYAVTVKDAAGNNSSTATVTDTKDTAAPVLSITAPMYVNLSNYTAVQVSGTTDTSGTLNVTARSSVTNSVTKQVTASGSTWSTSMDLTPLDQGTVTFTVSLTDAAGNTGSASAASTSTKDTIAPTVSAISLVNSGGTAGVGKAEQGDSLTIQFSEQMDATKICSAWNNTGTQTLNGNGDIIVNISTANVLTVTSGTCTLNVGSVFLGSNAKYGSAGALSFSGNGANASSVSWNGSNTLTIKLGKVGTATSGTTTTADSPSYSPGAGLADIPGNPLGAGPFAGAAARF